MGKVLCGFRVCIIIGVAEGTYRFRLFIEILLILVEVVLVKISYQSVKISYN
jgi:hypothetical protein